MNTNEIQLCIGILIDYMENCSMDGITKIPTYELLHVKNMLQKFISESDTEDDEPCLNAIAIEEVNRNDFEVTVDDYLQKGYEIIASSCNSKTWKAIMKRKDKENDE